MQLFMDHTGARAVWISTFDESSAMREFVLPSDASTLFDGVDAVTSRSLPYRSRRGELEIVGQHIDIVGEWFGSAAAAFDADSFDPSGPTMERLVSLWCEEVDNYLAAIARARAKHRVTKQLSEALNDPLLDRGILQAIEVLKANVSFDDMLLAYRHEDEVDGTTLRYKILKQGALVHDSSSPVIDPEVDRFMRTHALWIADGKDEEVPAFFEIESYREEVLISGIQDETLLGRLILTTSRGEFNTFDRDLVERFADYLRQRIVDFNREWKHLSYAFSQPIVSRLLGEEDYRARHLEAREQDVAILYSDISGFTRLSEQVLREPALIGELIDVWSESVVNIIWETGGVFDKMVGDCVIGLWGPPFFEWSAAEASRRAVAAALRIREYTASLGSDPSWPQLRKLEPAIGVSTGLNYCPLYVGFFGPNENYTGFSSGMNNAARLQGVAERDEILCMDRLVRAVEEPDRFGELLEADVKNVEQPLRFHRLLD